jgi:crossover junction endodeoxyribonuclease RuvC
MRLIGIDPGAKGAVALFVADGRFEQVQDMPTVKSKGRPRVDAAAFAAMVRKLMPSGAVVEQVASRPGQGVASMFTFGRACGIVDGVLAALQIPVTYVTASQWKGALRVPADKDGARARASQLIPQGAECWPKAANEGRAEATLIGLYGVRIDGKEVEW